MANQPGDVVERLHSEKRRAEHETEKQNIIHWRNLPTIKAKLGIFRLLWFNGFMKRLSVEKVDRHGGGGGEKAIILNQSQHDPIGDLRSRQGYCMWLTYSVSPGEGGPRWCSRREPSERARLQTRRHIGLVSTADSTTSPLTGGAEAFCSIKIWSSVKFLRGCSGENQRRKSICCPDREGLEQSGQRSLLNLFWRKEPAPTPV